MVSWEALIGPSDCWLGMDIYLNQYLSEWRDQERRDKGREEKDLMEDFVDMEMVKIEVEEEIWLQVRIVHTYMMAD